MRRKIIKQGNNTFTVSLPKKWCNSHNLKESEEIDINEKGNCLVISKETYRRNKEVKIDITGLSGSTVILLIESLYTYGYNNIIITTKNKKIKFYMRGEVFVTPKVINLALNRLIGAEITDSSNDFYKIQVITEESKEKFNTIIRRIFRLTINLFDTFVEGARKKDRALVESVRFKHTNIKKLINYALRILNKFGHEEADKTTFYFAIINFLNKIGEIIKNYAGYTIIEGKLNLSKKCCDMMDEISNAFKFYYEIFYEYDTKKINQLHTNRDLFKQKLYKVKNKTLTKDDIFILTAFTQIYDILLDLIELRGAIEY